LGYKRKVSYSHNSHIQSYKCIRVLCSSGSLCSSSHIRPTAAVKDMTDGKKIFGENKSPAMEESGKFVKKRWYPLPSNTQFVEARIKDAKLCATTR
jgi:hypothetical protein